MKFDEFKIKQICDRYGIKNYTIENGLVNVNGDVNISRKRLTKLPVRFGTVTGNFYCSYNQLTSLEGSPNEVGGDFLCQENKLTDLTGSPKEVKGGFFMCSGNRKLTSLEGSPELIEGKFYCSDTPVYSIYQSYDPGFIGVFNILFESEVNLDLIEYWFSIIKKPLTDQAIEEIKKHYPNI